MNQQQKADWVALSTAPRVGAKMIRRLVAHFGDVDGVLRASHSDLLAVTGVGEQLAKQIRAIDRLAIADQFPTWEKAGIRVLTWHDADYPSMLLPLNDAPPTLFMRGTWRTNETRTVALVGTRRPFPDAGQCTEKLATFFADNDWTVVSGLALGIDTHAHTGALAGKFGATVAVLGCGLNRITPARSDRLADNMLERGAIFSEFLPSAETTSPQLVARNRLISGLSRALIVVLAGADSGALHAVRFAKEQGRVVGAVDFVAEGNYQIIRDGGVLVRHDMGNALALLKALGD